VRGEALRSPSGSLWIELDVPRDQADTIVVVPAKTTMT
jgi:hypothetical protein